MAIHAVFLDIDGTLVDSNEAHVLAWQQAFDAGGYAIAAERIRKQIGKGADNLIPALIDGATSELQQVLETRHGDIFARRYLLQVKAFPGAAALIRTLHGDGVKVLLASSASQNELDHYIKLLGVSELLAGTVCADDVARSKPKGDIFRAALEKVRPIAAPHSLTIGDTPYDVLAAAKCRVSTIGLLSGGFSAAELWDAGALAIYENVADLLRQMDYSPLRTL
jgi:phosphoglycolate phosphatase-like HAD superfamily hydrolase